MVTGTPAALGIDVGGTKVAAGLVTAAGELLAETRRPTPDDADELLGVMVEVARELMPATPLPVGVGFPGLVDLTGGVHYGPNIVRVTESLEIVLTQQLDTHVLVDNDANAAAWAEFRVGAGRAASSSMVMLTLGTGLGGGLILGGRLFRGAHGFAGELGHVVIAADGAAGPSGIAGEAEAYAAGTALPLLAEEFRAAGRVPPGSPLDAADLDGEDITEAAQQGDATAVAVLAEMGRYLGITAAGLVSALDPELIVVGGGVIAAGDLVLEPARAACRAHTIGAEFRPEVPIVPAELGPAAGIVGAGLLVLESRR